jgi:hypothetical protein
MYIDELAFVGIFDVKVYNWETSYSGGRKLGSWEDILHFEILGVINLSCFCSLSIIDHYL